MRDRSKQLPPYRRGLFLVPSSQRDYAFDLAGGVLAVIAVALGAIIVCVQCWSFIARAH